MGRLLEEFAVVRRTYHLQFIVSVHLLMWMAGAFCLVPSAHGQLLADGIAAVVNDKVITYVQINQQVAETEKVLRQNLQGEELFQRVKEAKLNVLRALIERELIIQDFKTMGGFIPDTYTNERINDIIRDQYGGDRVAFIKTLYERGVTMQKYRDEIKDNAVVGYMRNKNVVQTVLVSPYQIEQYYQQNLRLFQQDEQIKVSTIVLRKSLFPVPERRTPTASRSPTIRRRKSRRRFSTSSIPAPISPISRVPIPRPATRTMAANSAG